MLFCLADVLYFQINDQLEASEPKRVNSDYILYGVNLLRLVGIQLSYSNLEKLQQYQIFYSCSYFISFSINKLNEINRN